MMTIKQTRIVDNYKALLKAGLDRVVARAIALKVSAGVILNIAVSDIGVHVEMYEVMKHEEKTMVFHFVA